MAPSKWFGVWSAGGSLALIIVGFAIHGSFEAQESVGKVARYYATHAHKANVWTGGYIEFLGYLVFAAFVAWLWTVLRSGSAQPAWPPALALIAGTLYVGLAVASFAPLGAALRRGSSIGAGATVALAELALWLYYLSWAVAALMLVAAATSIASGQTLPRWIGWVGVGVAVLLLAAVPLRLAGIDALIQLWGIAAGISWARGASKRSGEAPSPPGR